MWTYLVGVSQNLAATPIIVLLTNLWTHRRQLDRIVALLSQRDEATVQQAAEVAATVAVAQAPAAPPGP